MDDLGDGKLFRCSFCHKSQRQIRKLIAGPGVYICDECVDVCLQVVSSDTEYEAPSEATSAPDAATCSLCRLPTIPAAAVIVPDRGTVCAACAAAVAQAIAEKERPN